jgi:hypothetical protein
VPGGPAAVPGAHYEQRAPRRLVYVQLLRLDALLDIEHTQAILNSQSRDQRNELLRQRRDEIAGGCGRPTRCSPT